MCHSEYFNNYGYNIEKDPFIKDDEDDLVHLDFGYALSTYRSQGSEYKRVLLLDEYQGPQDIHNKFLYTGITRAMQGVDIVLDYQR